tara:strand:- start:227 stop:1063 length:837 start_codon:yes stop_codon:yes gene_type:complete
MIVNKFIKSGDIPQLLFVGSAGIGKTSLAKIITNNILQCQYLYINASDENGIDTIRSKVTNFSKTKSYDGSIKVIILDEVDGLTLDAQRCLRNTMEEYSEFTRFILTANYRHKVIPAVQSRCQSLDLIPPKDVFMSRCIDILEHEMCDNIDDSRDEITKLCNKYYPDLRKTINELQKSVIDNRFTVIKSDKQDIFVRNIYNCVKSGKTLKTRKHIIENEDKFNGDYQELLHQLFNHIHIVPVDDDTKRKQLLVTAEHIYRSAFVADQEINFYSCLLAL